MYKIINSSTGHEIARQVDFALTFTKRFKGLMGKEYLPAGYALVIHPCSSIHTCFMKIPIDVLFLDKEYRVLTPVENILPNRFSKIIKGSRTAIELPPGTIRKTGTREGHYINIKNPRGETVEISKKELQK